MCHTPALWKHTSRNIVFALVVDNFGVNYSNRKDAEHLGNPLQLLYPVTTDWTVLKTIGIHPEAGLHKHNIQYSYDQLRPSGTPPVPEQGTIQASGRPSPLVHTSIWPSNSKCKSLGHLPAPFPQINILGPEKFWHLPVLYPIR